jgi:ribosome-binding ATPase YchF (GTP1/OBG family)
MASVVALVCTASAITVHAQEQSMEERLRAQLRSVTSQLQQANNELALLKSGTGGAQAAAKAAPSPSPDVEALKAELAQSRQQLSRERDARGRRDADVQQAKETVDKAQAQVQQFRAAYNELLKMARTTETERQRLANEGAAQQAAVAQCELKNQQLYALGQEVLQAYEKMDMATMLAARQPFAAQSRVRLEQIAQEYGDRLYQGKFDARAATQAQETVAAEAAKPAQP